MKISTPSSSRHDEYPRLRRPGVVLGITREGILRGKLKELFLPGDIILFGYRQYCPGFVELEKQQGLARQSKWKGCDTCWADYVLGLCSIALCTISTVSSVFGSITSFTFSEVTSRIANMTLGSLLKQFAVPLILGLATLSFLAAPYLTDSSNHPHPHLTYRFFSRIFDNPNTTANFEQLLHIRSSFWNYLTKANASTHPRQHQPQQHLPSNIRICMVVQSLGGCGLQLGRVFVRTESIQYSM